MRLTCVMCGEIEAESKLGIEGWTCPNCILTYGGDTEVPRVVKQSRGGYRLYFTALEESATLEVIVRPFEEVAI